MLRTQIYLPASQLKFLKRKAADDNKSVSELIREAVEVRLEDKKKAKDKKKFKNAGELLLHMAREAKRRQVRGPKDLATNMDEYLYDKDFR